MLSGDILPFPGLPTSGAGLRFWGLAKGLEAKGHSVTLLMPQESVATFESLSEDLQEHTFTAETLGIKIKEISPDVIVLQHWPLAKMLPTTEIPLVIDLHGPLLLETFFQDRPNLGALEREKVEALSRADFLTCAGEAQRKYFYAWLLLAGFNLREDRLATIPVSLSPELPHHEARGQITFVFGGMFLPWQDPTLALDFLVSYLEERGEGVLKFFAGAHPYVRIPEGKFPALMRRLSRSEQVITPGLIPHSQLIEEYASAHVAIDVMAHNPERELAFTTRTVEYLWCGLPVIYHDYGELSSSIKEYQAGWVVDPTDEAMIREALDEIFSSVDVVQRFSRNAQKLVRERLTWDVTIAPLDRFCRNPLRRAKHVHSWAPSSLLTQIQTEIHRRDLERTVLEERVVRQQRSLQRITERVARRRRRIARRLLARLRKLAKRTLRVDSPVLIAGGEARVLPELEGTQCYGQSFVASHDNLCRIDVLFATYPRINTQDVHFRLKEHPGQQDSIVTLKVNATEIQDCHFHPFRFAALADSAGKRFYFSLDSPLSTMGDAVTVWCYLERVTPDVERYENGRQVTGELVFQAHYAAGGC
jgi:glycosyltransferase involved in cell wall biosynthesis